MKFECPNCSALVEPVDFKVQGNVAGWTCKECGASVSMGQTGEDGSSKDKGKGEADEKGRGDESHEQMEPCSASKKEESGDTPGTEEEATAQATRSCPKCGADAKNRDDCPRCGLVFSKWNPSKLHKLSQELSDERLDPLWEKVVADFQNDGVHEKFMDTSLRLNRLDFAAAKYRGYGVSHPTKKERIQELLEQVTSMAQFQVLRVEDSRREKKKSASPRKKKLMWGLVLFLLLAFLYIAFIWSPKPRSASGRDSDFRPGSQPVNLKKTLDGGG